MPTNKATICATVSPWLKERLEEVVAEKEISSMSELVSMACHEFLIRYFPEKGTVAKKKKE
jgi:hypothetical protein